jgi:hypothetical protein
MNCIISSVNENYQVKQETRMKHKLCTLCFLLVSLTLWLWRRTQHVRQKHQSIFNWQHSITSQKINPCSSLSLPQKFWIYLMFPHTHYLFHLIFLKLLTLAVQTITFTYNIKMDWIGSVPWETHGESDIISRKS